MTNTNSPATALTDNQIVPAQFAATKRIGFVLNAEGGLFWHEANIVLDNLMNEQHESICQSHTTILRTYSQYFGNVRVLPKEEEANDKFVSNDSNGHLYRSETLIADFHPFPDTDPQHVAFSLALTLAYTVCVQLRYAQGDGKPRILHSKFWYNAIATPKCNLAEGAALISELNALSEQIDLVGNSVMVGTIEFYENAMRPVKPMSFVGSTKNCRQISDVCIEFGDDSFNEEAQKIERGEMWLNESTGQSLELLCDVIRAAKNDSVDSLILNIDSPDVDPSLVFQRDQKDAKALYVVTNKGNLSDSNAASAPAVQRAFGVTSFYQQRRFVAPSDRAEQKLLHGRPVNSISVARVNIEAGAL